MKEWEVTAMSRELSIYEAMGGTYTEVDGVLYPDITISEKEEVWVGKYGFSLLLKGWEEIEGAVAK